MKIQIQRLAPLALLLWCCQVNLQASVRVYGEASSTGPLVQVQVFADISGPAIVSQTFRLSYIPSLLRVASATLNESTWYFHDGKKLLPQVRPDATTAGQVLFVGGHLDARTAQVGIGGNRILLGSVSFARRTQDTPRFELAIGHLGLFASFVTTNATILEAEPGVVTFQAVAPDADDTDLDGLTDAWEKKYFGNLQAAFYSDDADRDGANNLSEEAMGSDPTDRRSNLRVSIVPGLEEITLQWPSVEGRTYAIEGGSSLNALKDLKRGIRATPPLNQSSFSRVQLSNTSYFRIRVETPD
ncbi:MAG: hypothetical protein JNN07_05305 [Verrucomicrobiales bacterium]|nr:hypothetical protein [Verrucomicrobiales bacterium]